MAGTYVTATGFNKKTLAELKAELEAAYQGIFGDDLDLTPEGPAGQMIGLHAQREADLWDLAEEIYTSRNPGEATGTSLDNISAETGVARLDATKTRVSNVLCYGTEGTVLTATTHKAKQADNALLYELVTGITITKAVALKLKLEPNTAFPLTGGEVFTVTLDAVAYTYNGIALDTKKIVIDALVNSITIGAFVGIASNESNDFLVIDGDDNDSDSIPDTSFISLWTATFDLEALASGATFDAASTGVNTLPATTLDTIATSLAGWDSVVNPGAGVTGTAVETDAALRIRRALTFLAGAATDEAIRSALLNEVTGVTTAVVTSNRTMLTDADGRPPKSFEAVVVGGDDANVAQEIWETMPSGIESYGTTTEVIVDSEGTNQSISFSRPTNRYVHVRITKTLYSEETYPTNGDQAIKDAIVAWSLIEYSPGKDVIRLRISTPVYEIEGIEDITIEIDDTTNPGDVPAFVFANKPMNGRQLAVFATSRITVV